MERLFQRNGIAFAELWEGLDLMDKDSVIWQTDMCDQEMVIRKNAALGRFSLAPDEHEKIDKFLRRHLKMDPVFNIGSVDLTKSSFEYAFPEIRDKDEIFDALYKAFESSFPYTSLTRTSCWDALFQTVGKSLAKHCPSSSQTDTFKLALEFSRFIANFGDGSGVFPPEQILCKAAGYFLTQSEVTALANKFGGSKGKSSAFKAGGRALLQMKHLVLDLLNSSEIEEKFVNVIAKLLYESSKIDAESGEIAFPSKRRLSYLLGRLPFYLALSREQLKEVAHSLDGMTFSYPVTPLNPHLAKHVRVYALSLFRKFNLKQEVMGTIINFLMKIVI
jgi:hypothetical protein